MWLDQLANVDREHPRAHSTVVTLPTVAIQTTGPKPNNSSNLTQIFPARRHFVATSDKRSPKDCLGNRRDLPFAGMPPVGAIGLELSDTDARLVTKLFT